MHVETVVNTWLTGRFPTDRVVTETPADLVGALPLILVAGLPGKQKVSLASPLVDVESYAATRDAARTLAMQVHNALLFEMRGLVGDMLITKVEIRAYPAWRPYDNTKLRKFGALYQVYLHPAG
jgi:hypothetical protein